MRQAFLSLPPSNPYSGPANFNHDLLAQAADILNDAQKSARTPAMHHAIQAELDFINARLQPEAQLQRLAAYVAGPQHDPDFGQHLVDLNFLLDQGKSADAPLLQWMQFTGTDFGSNWSIRPPPPKGLQALAEARWMQSRQTPWLIALPCNPPLQTQPCSLPLPPFQSPHPPISPRSSTARACCSPPTS